MFTSKIPFTRHTLAGLCISGSLLLATATTAVAETPVTNSNAETVSLPTKLPSDIRKLDRHLPDLPGCNTQSGSLLELGDSYYDFVNPVSEDSNKVGSQTESESEMAEFRHLLAELDGAWNGHGAEKVCYLSGRERFHLYEINEMELTRFTSKQRYSAAHRNSAKIRIDRTRVASSEDNLGSGKIRSALLFSLPQLSELQHFEKLDDQYFKLRRLFREKVFSTGASILREREDWLQKTGNKLAWRTDWYTNGHYSGSEFNVLERR